MQAQYRTFEFIAHGYSAAAVVRLKAEERIDQCLVKHTADADGTRELHGWAHMAKRTSMALAERVLKRACGVDVSVKPGRKATKTGRQVYLSQGYLDLFAEAPIEEKCEELPTELPKVWEGEAAMYSDVRERMEAEQQAMRLWQPISSDELRPWQRKAAARVATQPKRTIDWIVDIIGGEGKTFFARWLLTMHDAYYVTANEEDSIKAYYRNQSRIVFDLTREQEREPPYDLIASFKEGMLYYDGGIKLFETPKVVVLSNWEPDISSFEDHDIRITRLPERDQETIQRVLTIVSASDDSAMSDIPDLVDKDGNTVIGPDPRDKTSPVKRNLSEMKDTDL